MAFRKKKKDKAKKSIASSSVKLGKVSIEDVAGLLEKKYQQPVISMGMRKEVKFIKTSIEELDNILGGGIPRSRITTLLGPEAGGKTAIALKAIAAVQALGGTAAFIDMEHALTFDWAEKLGVNTDKLYYSEPDFGEQAFDIVEMLLKTGKFDIIVVDSVSALTPYKMTQNEIVEVDRDREGELKEMKTSAQPGRQAAMISNLVPRVNQVLARTDTALVFVNQLRKKIGVIYGDDETSPGGLTLGYYSSVIVRVSRKGREVVIDRKTGEVIGHDMRCYTKKNKVATPFQEAEFTLTYNSALTEEEAAMVESPEGNLDIAVEKGLVEKKGRKFLVIGTKDTFRGVKGFIKYCEEHPEMITALKK